MTDKVLKSLWEKVKSHFIAHYENGSAKIIRDVFGYTINQIEKEDVFVLTKEQLQEVWDAAQEIHEDACPNDCVCKYQDLDDFLNQQSNQLK